VFFTSVCISSVAPAIGYTNIFENLKYGKLLNVWEIQNIYIYIMLLVWKEIIQVGEIKKIHQRLMVVE
jgi:hypothetical protein